MSQAPHETINVPNAEIGGDDQYYLPQSGPNLAPRDASTFVDGSGPIFSLYMEMATEEDKKIVENWKADADGMLIFTGLFSAAVASLISVSIQDIQQNPLDISNFYLANTYQATINPNVSSSLPTSPPPFSPPGYAVWINALWFLSLVISLTCALLATLLQQWARRYLKVTQTRNRPHKRARIRSFFAEGVDKGLLQWAVDALPTLLHISLFLFFAGLAVFLSNVNITIFKLVLSWVDVCTALYGWITLMPILRYDSPYYTPLSSPTWRIVAATKVVVYRVLQWFTEFPCFSSYISHFYRNMTDIYREELAQGMQKTAEEIAVNSSSDIDARAFMWTVECLDEDHELERFFSCIPGLRRSKFSDNLLPSLTGEQKARIRDELICLLDRTLSSDLLPAPVKNRRAMICMKAVDSTQIHGFSVLDRVLSKYQYSGPCVTEAMKILRSWRNATDQDAVFYAYATMAGIVAKMRPRDDSWYILASNELGISEVVLRDYATQGDSLSLAILIHIARQHSIHFTEGAEVRWMLDFRDVLEEASKLNVQDTSLELQHNFCSLWNQIVLQVQNDIHIRPESRMASSVLGPLRHLYIALHHDTDCSPIHFSASTDDWDRILLDPSAYPLCNIPDHCPESTTHIHDVSASEIVTPAVPHDHDNPALATHIPDTTSACIRVPLVFDGTFTDVPPLDNDISVSVRTTTEISSTLPSPVTTRAIRGSIDTLRPTHFPTVLERSASATPTSQASSSAKVAIAIEHTGVGNTTSNDVGVLSSPSPSPVLDNLHRLSESSSPMPAPAAREAPSTPRLDAPSEGGDNAKQAFREEKEEDAPYPSLVIHEDILIPPDTPSQSP